MMMMITIMIRIMTRSSKRSSIKRRIQLPPLLLTVMLMIAYMTNGKDGFW